MTNRPSTTQLERLVEFLEQNPGIAKGLRRTTQAKLETKRKWARLANTLNSSGGVNKDGHGWAKYWAEKKCSLKKQCIASMSRTGGGTAEYLSALSTLDKRFVAVMGGQEFATGSSSLTVNPFPTRVADSQVTVKEETLPEDTEMISIDVVPISGPSHNETIPASSTSSSSSVPGSGPHSPMAPPQHRRHTSTQRLVDVNMDRRFADIEEQRAEAELLTAQAFAELTEQIGHIASALTSMANAISDIARKMPDP